MKGSSKSDHTEGTLYMVLEWLFIIWECLLILIILAAVVFLP